MVAQTTYWKAAVNKVTTGHAEAGRYQALVFQPDFVTWAVRGAGRGAATA
jgi:hypothetical protein